MKSSDIKGAANSADKIFNSPRLLSSKAKSRRISFTKGDEEAFEILWGIFNDEIEASGEDWMSAEDLGKISKLYQKVKRRTS
ncbi:hypothetical protein C0Q44_28140 [Paenibacillus sp. PCH8]|uniref:hypothetical protein n=1 Tax=Paenibacillus sp. PCH8 TaxID=2066524 RepID=UPI000CF9BA7A|nr:hypothetical protein [Paenibacillus sp. PCH8]PQP80286.1 hypothetical protein C0Q44_28140 [Paenibacillus sp. PCH8]